MYIPGICNEISNKTSNAGPTSCMRGLSNVKYFISLFYLFTGCSFLVLPTSSTDRKYKQDLKGKSFPPIYSLLAAECYKMEYLQQHVVLLHGCTC